MSKKIVTLECINEKATEDKTVAWFVPCREPITDEERNNCSPATHERHWFVGLNMCLSQHKYDKFVKGTVFNPETDKNHLYDYLMTFGQFDDEGHLISIKNQSIVKEGTVNNWKDFDNLQFLDDEHCGVLVTSYDDGYMMAVVYFENLEDRPNFDFDDILVYWQRNDEPFVEANDTMSLQGLQMEYKEAMDFLFCCVEDYIRLNVSAIYKGKMSISQLISLGDLNENIWEENGIFDRAQFTVKRVDE